MSKESMMQFADNMLSRSAFLRDNRQDLEECSDPECPLPVSMLGYFGGQDAASGPWGRTLRFAAT